MMGDQNFSEKYFWGAYKAGWKCKQEEIILTKNPIVKNFAADWGV